MRPRDWSTARTLRSRAGFSDLLARQDGDTAIVAHRFAGPVWVAEVYPL